MKHVLTYIMLCMGAVLFANEVESPKTEYITHTIEPKKAIKIIELPATLRLEGEALFERVTRRLMLDSNLINELKVDSIKNDMLLDIVGRSDSLLLGSFLDESPSKEKLEHHFYLHLEGENKVVEDFYFFYLLNTASLYQMGDISEVILPNGKRINWREVYLRKILSLEKNAHFYGQKKVNELFTTLCVWDTLKIILNK